MAYCGKGNVYTRPVLKCSFIASAVECHACLLICLTHNSAPMSQAFSVEESLFSILMQSRSWVRRVAKWGILNLQILICAIILCVWDDIFYVNDRNSFQKMKEHSKRNCQHLKTKSTVHFVKYYFLKVQGLLCSWMSAFWDSSMKQGKFQGNSRFKFLVDAGFICDKSSCDNCHADRKDYKYTQ